MSDILKNFIYNSKVIKGIYRRIRQTANSCFIKLFPEAEILVDLKAQEEEIVRLNTNVNQLLQEQQRLLSLCSLAEEEKKDLKLTNEYLFEKQYKGLTRGRKIKVGFLVFFYEHWDSLDSVYQTLLKDDSFEPVVLIGPRKQFVKKWRFLEESEAFFKKRKINYLSLFCPKSRSWIDLKTLNLDLLIVNTPWEGSFPVQYHMENVSKYLRTCYIPYGIMAAQLQEHQFNLPFHHKSWRIFAESILHKQLYKKYSDVGDKNVIVTGYPKLDNYRQKNIVSDATLWRMKNIPNSKRIIWAPHWTVGNTSNLLYSSFLELKDYFYDLAKTNPQIEIMIKPHPGLWDNLKKTKLMTETEIKEMKKKYLELPNLWFYEEPGYFEHFKTADALILDSISFISEYYPTRKPMFFITKPGLHKFNEYGEIIFRSLYKGWTREDIDSFVKNVVVGGNDTMYNGRKNILKEYIYMPQEGAAQKISNYLKKELFDGKNSRQKS